MRDERQESTKQGIAPAPESEQGRTAEKNGRDAFASAPEATRPDGAMGGTSDADAPVDDAEFSRVINERADRREQKR